MFDYARNMQLALGDAGRRAGLKAAAGLLALIGAGFLVAALWTLLENETYLDWGPLWASVAIAVLFAVIGGIIWSMAKTVRHPVPTTDELRAEVETRVSLAADAALEKARIKATEVVDTVENRVHSLVDNVSQKASQFADDAEAKVQGFTRNAVGDVARKAGLGPQFFADTRDTVERVKRSNAATIPPLVGAFAVGIALASRLQAWRHQDVVEDDDYGDESYDRYYE